MALPWKVLDRVTTREGVLELRQRGPMDVQIAIGGLVLMNSAARRSEEALGTMACEAIGARATPRATPRVLVSGLGLGFTLRAVLDAVPVDARVTVAELNPVVVDWCRGPIASLTSSALDDPRVTVEITDVTNVIQRAATSEPPRCAAFDAIVLDLYTGPDTGSDWRNDPFYGTLAIARMKRALAPEGVLAVWGEAPDQGYQQRLQQAGFTVSCTRPGRGGLRHVVYLARPRA